MTPKAIVIDGDNLLWRSAYGLKSRLAHNGIVTNALVGFFLKVNSLLNEGYTHIAVGWDIKTEYTWRYHLMHKGSDGDYKDGRDRDPVMAAQVHLQKKYIKKLLRAFGIPQRTSPAYDAKANTYGFEADDIVGSVARLPEFRVKKAEVHILSSDKDFAQLVDDHIRVINQNKGVLDAAGVFEVYGIHPHQVIDYLSMSGDGIDNVPNIPGCGGVTAMKLLAEYGTYAEVRKHKADIKGKVGKALQSGEFPDPDLVSQLISIRLDAALGITASAMEVKGIQARYLKSPTRTKRVMKLRHHLGLNKTLIDLMRM